MQIAGRFVKNIPIKNKKSKSISVNILGGKSSENNTKQYRMIRSLEAVDK